MVFSVENCGQEFVRDLDKLLPRASQEEVDTGEVLEVRMGCVQDVRELVNHVLKRHFNCLWVDAACLVSPKGKKVIVCGKSHAGKSTLAMALSMGFGWSVLAEDIALIDPKTNQIITFASPFSIKEGTVELLKSAIGKAPEEITLKEWALTLPFAAKADYYAPFDVAIYLESPDKGNPIQTLPMSSPEFIRKLLLISNIIRKPQGAEKFAEYLTGSQIHQVFAGTVEERLQFVHELCGEPWHSIGIPADHRAEVGSRSDETSVAPESMPEVTESQKYARASHITSTILSDGYCVLASKSEDRGGITLTPAAAIVWEYCDGQHTVGQIIDMLKELSASADSSLEAETCSLIQELVESDVLTIVE